VFLLVETRKVINQSFGNWERIKPVPEYAERSMHH